jgi:hypothetical protein
MVNGFLEQDGKVSEWKDRQLKPLEMPGELKDLISNPVCDIDKDLQLVSDAGTMAMVDGRPVFSITIEGQPAPIAEYKDGKWQANDFQFLADEEHFNTVQGWLRKRSAKLIKDQKKSWGSNVYFIKARLVGVGVDGGQLAIRYLVNRGDMAVKDIPEKITFKDDLCLEPNGHGIIRYAVRLLI